MCTLQASLLCRAPTSSSTQTMKIFPPLHAVFLRPPLPPLPNSLSFPTSRRHRPFLILCICYSCSLTPPDSFGSIPDASINPFPFDPNLLPELSDAHAAPDLLFGETMLKAEASTKSASVRQAAISSESVDGAIATERKIPLFVFLGGFRPPFFPSPSTPSSPSSAMTLFILLPPFSSLTLFPPPPSSSLLPSSSSLIPFLFLSPFRSIPFPSSSSFLLLSPSLLRHHFH